MIAKQIHVAILDDDPSIRIALVRLLQAAEMAARAYATSAELFESVALKCPDCLLLDLQMMEMHGLDVLKYLNQRQIRIPTIVITGQDEKISREARTSPDVVALLRKPLEADQLIRMIEEIAAAPRPGTSFS
ncbi:MAG TPA: response regulator [Rhizomicrobium sp.]|nr:response regulator [Rhizomicrobium sp.]